MAATAARPRFVRLFTLAALLASLTLLPPPTASAAEAEPGVTLTSHADGDRLPTGKVRLSGTYTDAYDLAIALDGDRVARVHTSDPDGDDSGTWHYDLDTTGIDGDFAVSARARSTDTRYGLASPFITLTVDNAAANVPEVRIASPGEGETVRNLTPVRVEVDARNRLRHVSVRINGGRWRPAPGAFGTYVHLWNASRLGDATVSVEARATDRNGNTGYSPTVYASVGRGAAVEPVQLPEQDRAMWIWEKSAYNLVLNPGSRRLLKTFAEDDTFGPRPVTTLYFGVDRYADADMLNNRRRQVEDFLTWAHAEGFQVFATVAGGTQPPYLGGVSDFHDRAVKEYEKVLNYNLSAGPRARFDGVNVDIEPYIDPRWGATKPAIQVQWLEILEKLIERRDAAGSSMPFGPAIPRWLDTSTCCNDITWKGETKPLSEHIQDITDYISIMDYRDTADGGAGIITQAANEIAYAETIGKPGSVVLGVESLDIAWSGDPETITFREEGRTVMEHELDKVYAAFAESPAFGGVALHHYDSLRVLPSAWGPQAVYPPLPPDRERPSRPSGPLAAETFDHQSIDLTYGRAYDDTDVEEYRIYRSTSPDFVPESGNVAGSSRGLTYTDAGLLPDTTYYYRVAAVDSHGNVGPASKAASATTGTTTLRPLIVDELTLHKDADASAAGVRLRVADRQTGEGLAATVHGRFTKAAGKYVVLTGAADGLATGTSEAVPSDAGQVGYQPLRITAPGYYWASAYDRARNVEVSWPTAS